RRNYQLHQVDAQTAVTAEQVVRAGGRVESRARAGRGSACARWRQLSPAIIRVHPAVAIHRYTKREVGTVFPVDPELGDEEVGAVAVDGSIEAECGRAATRCAAMRAEPGGAELPLAVEERHRAGIDRAAERLLRDGDRGAAHADRLHAVAVGKIAVGRGRDPRAETCRGERE